jgi:hypothetical protein
MTETKKKQQQPNLESKVDLIRTREKPARKERQQTKRRTTVAGTPS